MSSSNGIGEVERQIEFDFLRATEAAALNTFQWLGKGQKEKADEALHGVEVNGSIATTHSVIMRAKTGTVRFIKAHHDLKQKPSVCVLCKPSNEFELKILSFCANSFMEVQVTFRHFSASTVAQPSSPQTKLLCRPDRATGHLADTCQ
jgi:hypothetical protein